MFGGIVVYIGICEYGWIELKVFGGKLYLDFFEV